MRSSDYLRHLRLIQTVSRLGARQRRLWEQTLILYWVWQRPFCSAGDLLAHDVFAQPRLYDLVDDLRNRGYLSVARMGSTRNVQRRYFLTLRGVDFVRERLGVPLEWQVMRPGLERLSRYAAFFESAYQLGPRLWRSTAAFPLDYALSPDPATQYVTFGPRAQMYRFVWVRRGPVHAIAQYVNDRGDEIDVPFIWYGSQHGPSVMEGLDTVFQGVEDPGPTGLHRPRTRPPGVVFICADQLGALRVQREFARGIPKAVVTVDGEVAEVLDPVPQKGHFRLAEQPLGRTQSPDTMVRWLEENPQAKSLNGGERRRVFSWIEHYPGSRVGQVARGVGLRNTVVRGMVDAMAQCDLVRELEDGFYPGVEGMLYISRRDRVSLQTVKARFEGYLSGDGRYRSQQRRHDRGVATLADLFGRRGMRPFTGRRMVLNFEGITQLKPDLWVLVPLGDGSAIFAAVELEYSAKAHAAITGKLGPSRLAKSQAGEPCPLLVVTGTAGAADLFASLGDDLPMLATSEGELKQCGPGDPVWRWRGQRVPATHLATLVQRGDLIQSIGRPVEYRTPPAAHGA